MKSSCKGLLPIRLQTCVCSALLLSFCSEAINALTTAT